MLEYAVKTAIKEERAKADAEKCKIISQTDEEKRKIISDANTENGKLHRI